MKRFTVFFALFTIVTIFSFTQQKFALVIGNGNYTGIGRLANPVNDANDMEAALRDLGFTVDKVLNGNLEQMEDAVLNLKRRLGGSRNTYGFLFYAGHGVQAGGENYLIPVAAEDIRSDTHLRTRAVPLQFILDSLSEAGNELNMVVLDACRDNPFSWARSGSRGLSVVSRAPTGTIVMYAAGAGQTASDGQGRNGLFTGYLLNNLKTPGLSVFDVFDRTMSAMINATNGSQHPELSLRAGGTTSIFLGSTGITPPAVPANMVRINGGTFTMGSPANETGRDNDETQHQVTVSSFYMGKYEVTVGEFRRFVNATGYITDAEKSGGGYVWTTEWELKSDANWKNPYFNQGENHPVTLVSWNDTVQYCNWLSRQEGLTPAYTISGANVTWNRSANGYRLPTEAEWEYACRAGTTTVYNTGNMISDNTGWYWDNSNSRTHEVGLKPPNAWGLFDMHGNVWEWCWDWYGTYPSGAQTDPVGVSSGSNRVLRGGGWGFSAARVRSASRNNSSPTYRDYYRGFRVVRP
ncbi:MAG: SUMF1/EgtB/PvdO family nonheme iron enzyme [Treponema sp.]|nr:SUMF1/EgtB/PvdO family nonheme iron enzyme [Treponema sp.]